MRGWHQAQHPETRRKVRRPAHLGMRRPPPKCSSPLPMCAPPSPPASAKQPSRPPPGLPRARRTFTGKRAVRSAPARMTGEAALPPATPKRGKIERLARRDVPFPAARTPPAARSSDLAAACAAPGAGGRARGARQIGPAPPLACKLGSEPKSRQSGDSRGCSAPPRARTVAARVHLGAMAWRSLSACCANGAPKRLLFSKDLASTKPRPTRHRPHAAATVPAAWHISAHAHTLRPKCMAKPWLGRRTSPVPRAALTRQNSKHAPPPRHHHTLSPWHAKIANDGFGK
jgi:hypothetical protein